MRKFVLLITCVLLAAVLFTYLSLALIGLIRGAHPAAILMMVGIAAYLLLLSGGDAGYHRFRMPLTPVICLLAAEGYGWLLICLGRRTMTVR